MSSSRQTYRFGPLERRALLGPLNPGQAAILGVAALVAVSALDAAGSATGVLFGLTALAAAGVLVTVPVAGRTLDGWVPVGVAFLVRRGGRGRCLAAPAATAGMRWRPDGGFVGGGGPAAPPELAGVELIELGFAGRRLGALSEGRGRRLTAVLACRVLGFALLDAEAQERRLARWGVLLSSLSGTPVRRLQWLERTAPARSDELARWAATARDPAIPLRGAPILDSYLELIANTAQASHEHEILVAVQVERGAARERRETVEVLGEQVARIGRALEAAEVKVLGALTARQLARCLRTGFDPFAGAELSDYQRRDREPEEWRAPAAGLRPPAEGGPAAAEGGPAAVEGGRAGVVPWPLAAREAWDHHRCDGALHATFWIAAWPRVEVSPMFMDPLLGSSGVARTVAVTLEPVAPERSTREVEAAITRDRADRELRQRFGQSETARQRQAQEAAMRREAELAAGHAEVRLSGFVTVSGRDERELARATSEVLGQAARARLELRRLYGQQAEAFTFTLPLARGLR